MEIYGDILLGVLILINALLIIYQEKKISLLKDIICSILRQLDPNFKGDIEIISFEYNEENGKWEVDYEEVR
jgi:hypothetical protein